MFVPIPVTFTTKKKAVGYSTGKCGQCGQTEVIRTDGFRTLEYLFVIPYYSHGWSNGNFCDFCESKVESDAVPAIKARQWTPNEAELERFHNSINPETPFGKRDPNRDRRLNAMLHNLEKQWAFDTPNELPFAIDSDAYHKYKSRVHQKTFTNYLLVLLPILMITFFGGILVGELFPRYVKEQTTNFTFGMAVAFPFVVGAIFYLIRKRTLLYGKLTDKCRRYQIDLTKLSEISKGHPYRIQKTVEKVAKRLSDQALQFASNQTGSSELTRGKREVSTFWQWTLVIAFVAFATFLTGYIYFKYHGFV